MLDKYSLPRARAAVPLEIHIIKRLSDKEEHISRKDLVSEDKLISEEALEEVKVDLGWELSTRKLIIALPEHKYIGWMTSIEKITNEGQSNQKTQIFSG